MKPELEEQLVKKYPKIFADVGKSPQETCMAWGVDCDGGWFDIIDILCHHIQQYVDQSGASQVVAEQVKEKFGEMRFYFSGGNDYVEGLVDMACGISRNICELCGNKGKIRGGGWLKCRCDTCEEKHAKGED